jgi:predicted phage terminase large subunit-like protein
MVRDRVPAHRHLAWLAAIVRRYRPQTVVVERTGGVHDDAFVHQLSGQLQPLGVWVSPVKVTRSKEDRARIAAAKMERGEVYLPHDAPWRPTLDSELLAFPRGRAHDDIVDCFSLAAIADVRHQIGGTLSASQAAALSWGGGGWSSPEAIIRELRTKPKLPDAVGWIEQTPEGARIVWRGH